MKNLFVQIQLWSVGQPMNSFYIIVTITIIGSGNTNQPYIADLDNSDFYPKSMFLKLSPQNNTQKGIIT